MKSQKGQILYWIDRFAARVLRIVVVLFVVLLVLACFGIESRYAWYISGGLFTLSVLCRIILSPLVKSEEEEEFEQQVEYILSKKSCEESKPSVTNTDYTPLRNLNHSQEGLVKQHLFRLPENPNKPGVINLALVSHYLTALEKMGNADLIDKHNLRLWVAQVTQKQVPSSSQFNEAIPSKANTKITNARRDIERLFQAK